ncbi:YdeI/OmpD-associated family protein [Cohnella candidum]|uniref:DUF1905 domain-containing protein n=1 Tax=Cohnella candidum TaxID=2674991 RepID=A0A3G3JWJ2_9BACL|nr:YdeI/OmpD-associated family protein [Cohnella candidum]AYQ72623.1 DUF1905 domain-containing protein [Cohnella candidum]
MKFEAVLELHGKTATGIEVPQEVMAALGTSKKPAVRVTIGEYAYRTTIGVMGGRYLIPVSAEHRAAAGIAAGEKVKVQLELDTEPRELTLPDDFSDALHREENAERFFNGLSNSNKRRFVLPIEDAKTADTRQKRIDKAIRLLNEGKLQ